MRGRCREYVPVIIISFNRERSLARQVDWLRAAVVFATHEMNKPACAVA
jgi:hypothetical protein